MAGKEQMNKRERDERGLEGGGWKKSEDKAGEQEKEGTDENAGQVIIPPTSFVPWITVLDTHMHAREIDVEPGVIRLGSCLLLSRFFVFSAQAGLQPYRSATVECVHPSQHNCLYPNCMSKFRAIILEKQLVREHKPTVN